MNRIGGTKPKKHGVTVYIPQDYSKRLNSIVADINAGLEPWDRPCSRASYTCALMCKHIDEYSFREQGGER